MRLSRRSTAGRAALAQALQVIDGLRHQKLDPFDRALGRCHVVSIALLITRGRLVNDGVTEPLLFVQRGLLLSLGGSTETLASTENLRCVLQEYGILKSHLGNSQCLVQRLRRAQLGYPLLFTAALVLFILCEHLIFCVAISDGLSLLF